MTSLQHLEMKIYNLLTTHKIMFIQLIMMFTGHDRKTVESTCQKLANQQFHRRAGGRHLATQVTTVTERPYSGAVFTYKEESMGDRGTVKINGITLYTHWSGDTLERDIKKAYEKKGNMLTDLLNVMSHGDREPERYIEITPLEIDLTKGDHVIIDSHKRTVDGMPYKQYASLGLPRPKDPRTKCSFLFRGTNVGVTFKCPGPIGDRVHAAIQEGRRWDDDAYLCRIVYDSLAGWEFEECGFGMTAGDELRESCRHVVRMEDGTSFEYYNERSRE